MLLLHILTAVALGAAAAVAISASRDLHRRRRHFATIFGLALALGAVEKLARLIDLLHEGLHRLGFGDPPFLNGIDDVVLLLLAAAAVVFFVAYRQVVRETPRLAAWLGIAAVLAALSFAIDAFGPADGPLEVFEECLELTMAVVLLFAARTLRAAPLIQASRSLAASE